MFNICNFNYFEGKYMQTELLWMDILSLHSHVNIFGECNNKIIIYKY